MFQTAFSIQTGLSVCVAADTVTLCGIGSSQALADFTAAIDTFSPEASLTPITQEDASKLALIRDLNRFNRSLSKQEAPEQTPTQPLSEYVDAREIPVIDLIKNKTSDPHIRGVYLTLYRAGFLEQQDNNLFVRKLQDWHEGMAVIDILDACILNSPYDLLDIIHFMKDDWGPFRPFGFKDINASIRSLGLFERYENIVVPKGDITKLKHHCLTHITMDRLQFLVGYAGLVVPQLHEDESISANFVDSFAKYQAALDADKISRLIVEMYILKKMTRVSEFETLARQFLHFEETMQDIFQVKELQEILKLTPDEYSAKLKQIFTQAWNRIILPTKASVLKAFQIIRQASQFAVGPTRVLQSPDPDERISIDMAEEIRGLQKDFILFEGLLPTSAHTLKILRLAKFIAGLAPVLPYIDLPDNGHTTQEKIALYLETFLLLCDELSFLLASKNIEEQPRIALSRQDHVLTRGDIRQAFWAHRSFTRFTDELEFVAQWAARYLPSDKTQSLRQGLVALSQLWKQKMPF